MCLPRRQRIEMGTRRGIVGSDVVGLLERVDDGFEEVNRFTVLLVE
jgi:hypothetical protein